MNRPKRTAILIGLLLCMGASTIMQTYFSSALPAISSSFQSVSFYSGHASGVNSTAHLIRNFGGSIGTILFQFSLSCPQQYYIGGILILAVSGAIAVSLSLRFEHILNEPKA